MKEHLKTGCCLGGPVLVLPLGKIGVRTIQKSLKEDEIIRQIIKLIEQRPNPDVQFSALIDCHDVCLRQVLYYFYFVLILRGRRRYFFELG